MTHQGSPSGRQPARPESPGTGRGPGAADLVRLGFVSGTRAAALLAGETLAPLAAAARSAGAPLAEALGAVADPVAALLMLVRLREALAEGEHAGRLARLDRVLTQDTPERRRLLAVLGASTALGDLLISHPQLLDALDDTPPTDADDERARALRAVGATPADPSRTDLTHQDDLPRFPRARLTGTAGADALRLHYRARVLRLAAQDLTTETPTEAFEAVAAALADLAGAAIEAAVAVARAEAHAEGRPEQDVRLAVIGMGKTGGRELNYVSDVDVLHVVAPAAHAAEVARGEAVPDDPRGDSRDESLGASFESLDEGAVTELGAQLARRVASLVAGPAGVPALWPLDANLRPEGKDGPLVRTLASYRSYYRRWARTWEFQALLKARPIAGDLELGQEFVALTEPFVWEAAGRENFVTDVQAMRRRVESLVPAKEAERQIKLGRGGLRDVEFTVQLLQLVHGRTDVTVRDSSTLGGLAGLTEAGYVGRDAAALLARDYRFERTLEHRLQLSRLRRTHVLPTGEAELRRLARALADPQITTAADLDERWRAVRREVRGLHEAIFYRPLLPLTAQLSEDVVALAPQAAEARLAAIGYRAPARALQQIAALTEGLSRRAAIQRQLLPVLLGWFAEGPDPDAGLLGFRRLSDRLGTTHWYMQLLRDSGTAARAVTRALSHSAYVADELPEIPDAVQWLDEDADLAPRDPQALRTELDALLSRRETPEARATAVRYLRRRELLRAALGDVLTGVDVERAGTILTPVADLALGAALSIAEARELERHRRAEPLARFAIIAMGRLGGRETGYASDADVLFVHEAMPGVDEESAAAHAADVAAGVRSLLGDPGEEPPFPVDADLRPEGRHGPLIRSLASYAEYYARWAHGWERQALLRARVVAGDAGLAARTTALIDAQRYPDGGFAPADQLEIRRLKARMEAERMPRGLDPARHLKLGRGSLSDIEWTAQLLAARHAGDVPALRTTSTLGVLRAAADEGLLAAHDAATLTEAWTLAANLRAAIVLATGRRSGAKLDQVPTDPRELETVARLLGHGPGERLELEEDYLRLTRRARGVVEKVFYG